MNEKSITVTVSSDENVARLISSEWMHDSYTKSHAGIFVRYQNKNVKRGQMIKISHVSEEISSDTLLLEVRTQLLELATLEECKIATTNEDNK